MKLKKENIDKNNKEVKQNKVKEFFKIWGKWYMPVIAAIVIIAIFIGINLLVEMLKLPTIDLTINGKYTLTDITKDYLKDGLDKNVKIYVMYEKIDGVVPATVDGIQNFLLNYEKYSNGRVKVEMVDASQNKELASKYEVSLNSTNGSTFSVVYEYGQEFKKVDEYGFYSREKYEEVSTNAILEVTNEKTEKVYFIEGYSNASLDNAFSLLTTYMQKEIFNIESLRIKLVDKIPDDASVVILCGLDTDIDEKDLAKVIDYYENGGKVIVLEQYVDRDLPNLQKLVGLVGIQFNNNVIYEGNSSNRLANAATTIIPIYADMTLKSAMDKKQSNVIFDAASSLNILNSDEQREKNIIVNNLLITSDKAWTSNNYTTYSEVKPSNAQALVQVVGAIGMKSPENSSEGRIVVYTNDYFIRDDFVSRYQAYGSIANIDYFVENLIMLTGRTDMVSIDKEREYPVYKVYTSTAEFVLQVISYAIPILVLVIGLIIWIYRKNRK